MFDTHLCHKLCEKIQKDFHFFDLGGELLFVVVLFFEVREDLVDALAVDEDGACEGERLEVVAEGVAAGDGEGLDVRERPHLKQRFESVAPVILFEGVFCVAAEHLEILQVHKLRHEAVRSPSEVRAELERGKVELLVHGGLGHAKVHAHAVQVAHDIGVRGRAHLLFRGLHVLAQTVPNFVLVQKL